MWTDLITASAILLFIGLLFRFHQAKIGKLEDNKMDKELFRETQKAITEDLKRGEKKFDKVFDILTEQGKCLARIDERTLNLAKKNRVT